MQKINCSLELGKGGNGPICHSGLGRKDKLRIEKLLGVILVPATSQEYVDNISSEKVMAFPTSTAMCCS
tara:strand:+ start:354 stop:560 length:207 start_codon:yes stop_codon:yes gene_type:complete